MLIPILQALLTAVGCYGLWRFWRVLDGRGVTSRIVAAGLVIRALGGQLLFWISWLRLPVARSLQIGDGLWFFAFDGRAYLSFARELLGGDPAQLPRLSGDLRAHPAPRRSGRGEGAQVRARRPRVRARDDSLVSSA